MIRFNRSLMGALLALTLFICAVAPAIAGDGGLGSHWPSAPDVSANPQFHVYRWVSNGVTYVQVNDIAGNVKMAFGVVGQVVFVLPIGDPSTANVLAPAQSSAASSDAPVYSDSTVTVTQSPTSTFHVVAADVKTGCTDPAECSAVATP